MELIIKDILNMNHFRRKRFFNSEYLNNDYKLKEISELKQISFRKKEAYRMDFLKFSIVNPHLSLIYWCKETMVFEDRVLDYYIILNYQYVPRDKYPRLKVHFKDNSYNNILGSVGIKKHHKRPYPKMFNDNVNDMFDWDSEYVIKKVRSLYDENQVSHSEIYTEDLPKYGKLARFKHGEFPFYVKY